MTARKAVIYGSCVSRDTFSVMESNGWELLSYTARQSLISTFSDKSEDPLDFNAGGLASGFQRRMLSSDLRGSLLDDIDRTSGKTDVLLMDFIDERGGVLEYQHGRFITNSLELKKSGLLENFPIIRAINFGTDEHFALWRTAFDRFAEFLEAKGLGRKLVLVRAAWADGSVEGDIFPLPGSNLLPASMNALYARYYDYAQQVWDTSVIEVPTEFCMSVRDHKWGLAPFHYGLPFYNYVTDRIDRLFPSSSV